MTTTVPLVNRANDVRERRWRRQMASAIRLNATDPQLREFAHAQTSNLDAARLAAEHIRRVLPYRFLGEGHRTLELAAARRRGFGACSDATAALAAVMLWRTSEALVCYENAAVLYHSPVRLSEALRGYAHVRLSLGRDFVDAYPDASLEASRCALLFRVTREGVKWPAHATVAPS
jgi:hypothetical protein